MEDFNLTSGEPTQVGPVQITYGPRGAGLERASELLTYIYAPRGGTLEAYQSDIPVPARAIVRIAPGIASRFYPDEETLETVVFRIEDKIPALTAEQEAAMARHNVTPALIDYEQWHRDIKQYVPRDRAASITDGITVLPKFKPDGTHVPGWPCNYRKGQILQLDGAAEWTEIRAAEQPHYHIVMSEIYVGLNGGAKLRYNDDTVELKTGHALLGTPGNIHCVVGITPGPAGIYSHTVAQYPPVQNDKIVVD